MKRKREEVYREIAWVCIWGAVAFLVGAFACANARTETVAYEFSAKWCGPCQQMAQVIDGLRSEGYAIETFDIDDYDVSPQFNLASIPTFIVYRDGVEVDRVVGETTRDRLMAKLQLNGRREKVTAPTSSQNYPLRKSVVRISCGIGKHLWKGSGVIVRWGHRIFVLTANHVINGGGKITAWTVTTGKAALMRVVNVDAVWDCAVLEFATPPPREVIQSACDVATGRAAIPTSADSYDACGYGSDETFAVVTGPFAGFRGSPSASPFDYMAIKGKVRHGDSGGPIFNRYGQVMSVLCKCNGEGLGEKIAYNQIVVGSTFATEFAGVQPGRLHILLDEAAGTK